MTCDPDLASIPRRSLVTTGNQGVCAAGWGTCYGGAHWKSAVEISLRPMPLGMVHHFSRGIFLFAQGRILHESSWVSKKVYQGFLHEDHTVGPPEEPLHTLRQSHSCRDFSGTAIVDYSYNLRNLLPPWGNHRGPDLLWVSCRWFR